jgi:putative alpha-1,2-mannosidase
MPGTLIDAVIADAAVKKIRPDLMPRIFRGHEKRRNSSKRTKLIMVVKELTII